MRFVDLFAGLGGFHIALRKLGHECVFASEIDHSLRELYERNFGIVVQGDIKRIKSRDVPPHDLLCAGFPCQPFSKAGNQLGVDCPSNGNLFGEIVRILRYRRPRFLILENVPNLVKHKGGDTWNHMEAQLRHLGYDIDFNKLSPHQYGVPHFRERLFIVGARAGLGGFKWPAPAATSELSIRAILDRRDGDGRAISEQLSKCLDVWQEFIESFPADEELPSFPIWSMEFGADYPYEEATPYALGTRRLREFRGSHGVRLDRVDSTERMLALPSYARTTEELFPLWKQRFIYQNRELYKRHRSWIDRWIPSIRAFPPSLQKFEWNCKGDERRIGSHIIQVRASGIRVKRPTTAPSLVAMTSTQIPIIGWDRRYMTARECSRLQSLGDLEFLPDTLTATVSALGNAVNAKVVQLIANSLIDSRTGQQPRRLTMKDRKGRK